MSIYVQKLGKSKIFRPRRWVVNKLQSRFHELLLRTFGPGEYRQSAAPIVLNHGFELYETLLRSLIPQIASRDALEFILYQFDQGARIRHGDSIKSQTQKDEWTTLEGCHGRAVKYLAELVCLENVNRLNSHSNSADALLPMEGAFYCAEKMADLAEMSERMHSVFPKQAFVKVFPLGAPEPWTGGFEGPNSGYDIRFFGRIERDRHNRRHVLEGELERDLNAAPVIEILDPAFESSLGVKLSALLNAIRLIVENSRPAPDTFPTLFVNRSSVIAALCEAGLSERAAELAMQGFTLTPENMMKARRILWNPKQEHRAYRRGFFLVKHDAGPHLAFSRAMAYECFIHLIHGLTYKKLPQEWRTEQLKKPLEDVSRSASDWFEELVGKKMKALGVVGQRFKKVIGTGHAALPIPENVGDIDFLGRCPKSNILILTEAKMTNTGLEAKHWRDDMEDFVLKERGSYQSQITRKAEWVSHSINRVCEALNVPNTSHVGSAIVTLYPCIAQEELIGQLPCVSITELVLDWREKEAWPYASVPVHS